MIASSQLSGARRERDVSDASAPERSRRRPIGIDVTDEALVRRMRNDDTWAQEAFYRKHVDVVFRTALRLVGNRTDAEDVVQDTFVEAFADLASLREPGAARGWVLRIAVFRAHRLFRRRKLLRLLGLDRSDEPSLATLASSAASQETRAELGAVDRALGRVSALARTAWVLRYVEGHALLEVGELTGVSLATVKRRIAEAALSVQRELGQELAEVSEP